MIDIKGFPIRLKNMLVNAFMLPFWYIAIYLFGPSIYNQNDLILTLSICIALATASAFLAYANVYVDEAKYKPKREGLKPFNHATITKSLSYQIIYMSFLIIISYLIPRTTNIPRFEFYGFVLAYFTPWTLYVFKTFEILSTIQKHRNHKKDKVSKKDKSSEED